MCPGDERRETEGLLKAKKNESIENTRSNSSRLILSIVDRL